MRSIYILVLLSSEPQFVLSVRPTQNSNQCCEARTPPTDPKTAANKIKEACEVAALDEGENALRWQFTRRTCPSTNNASQDVTVGTLRKCADELQKYAETTKQGMVESIEAEKEFVKEYSKAAQQIARIGDVDRMWQSVQSDINKSLQVLLGDADETDKLAKKMRPQTPSDEAAEGQAS
ncbi:unnamed protein product [Symbiodinium sp. KB8]|nr:unnamed protein product [Symbiodinium sp. KB8]